jgi:hypothetical protein
MRPAARQGQAPRRGTHHTYDHRPQARSISARTNDARDRLVAEGIVPQFTAPIAFAGKALV